MFWFLLAFTGCLAALLVLAGLGVLLRGPVFDRLADRMLMRILRDPYPENLYDLVIGMTRVPPTLLMELELRAEFGSPFERPLGSIRRVPGFERLSFDPAQLAVRPLDPDDPVDLSTVIGPRCPRPLRLDMPVLVSAMGYGTAVSEPFALALARGATRAGTAYNAGVGPLLPEIRQEARHLILQYATAPWTRRPQVLAQADMVEIRFGHGGRASLGRIIAAKDLSPRARELIGLEADEARIASGPPPGAGTPAELRDLVPELRQLIGGGPVGVKLAASHRLERELAAVLEAGVDVIAIDGGQGGTHSSPPIICDDFGIPTLHALHRAARFLERQGARRDVSLVVGGGLVTPGDFLKAIALGADAVYVGTVAMMAATHGQLAKSVPSEPITQIVWATGKRARDFNVERGAETVANFLLACAGELREGCRALGRRSVREVGRQDLVALDRETAEIMGLSPSWRAPSRREAGPASPRRKRVPLRRRLAPSGPAR